MAVVSAAGKTGPSSTASDNFGGGVIVCMLKVSLLVGVVAFWADIGLPNKSMVLALSIALSTSEMCSRVISAVMLPSSRPSRAGKATSVLACQGGAFQKARGAGYVHPKPGKGIAQILFHNIICQVSNQQLVCGKRCCDGRAVLGRGSASAVCARCHVCRKHEMARDGGGAGQGFSR